MPAAAPQNRTSANDPATKLLYWKEKNTHFTFSHKSKKCNYMNQIKNILE